MRLRNNEKGYALYLVVVVSFLIFMVLSQTIIYYVNQVNLVQMKEDQLRAQLLLQSAVLLWIERIDHQFMEEVKPGSVIEEIELEGGVISFYKLVSINQDEWVVRVSAKPYQNDVRYRAELTLTKDTKQIQKWSEKISD